jgi:hypothetical protein
MPRRSTPAAKTDDLVYPVRIKIVVPPLGLGRMLTYAIEWLHQEIGPGNWANHGQPGLGGSTAAFYFRTTDDAQRFVEAFPDMELADGERSVAYRSPAQPLGD